MTAGHDDSSGDDAAQTADHTEAEAPLREEGASAEAGPDAAAEPGPAETTEATEAAEAAEATEATEAAEPAEPADPLAAAEQALEERTQDLQRLQAEFVNYKRRVERDRDLVRQNATYAVLAPIIEVLDTIDRAREHGDLEPGLKTVADQLERTVSTLGLEKFGTAGDAFDPALHEALSHLGEDPEVEVTTCKVVAKSGYRIGDRVVRAAQVLVADPPA